MNRIKEMLFVFVLLILSTTVFAGLYYLIAKLFFLLKIDFFPYFSRVVKIWIIFFLCFIFANKRFGDVIDWKRIKYIEKNNEDRRPFLFFILFVVFSAFLGFISFILFGKNNFLIITLPIVLIISFLITYILRSYYLNIIEREIG